MNTVETQILANLLHNEEFVESAYPYIKSDYFSEIHEQLVFDLIHEYVDNYGDLPNQDVLLVELDALDGIPKDAYDNSKMLIKRLKNVEVDLKWLMQTAEQWCKHRSMHNAVVEAANLLNDKNVNSYGNINQLIEAAQAVSFNKDIGHNLFDNAEARWDFFNAPKYKIPFGHRIFDEITDGGMSRKTLTLILANANCGKSLVMCDIAANVLNGGQNVLFITLELSEQMVARRIESNLLNIDFHSIKDIPREKYISRINKLKMSTHGKLIVKEYANGSASCRDFQTLLNELKRKKLFTPDLIVVDYLGIIANAVTGKDIQGHEALAAISGQLRRLAMENDVPVLSAHQLNRGSEGKTDVNASDIAGSYGIMRDPDLVLGIINTPEHRANGIIEFKQLKNRDSSTTNHGRFSMNINAARMTLSDIDEGNIRTLRDVTNRTDSDEDFGNLNQKRELSFSFDEV